MSRLCPFFISQLTEALGNDSYNCMFLLIGHARTLYIFGCHGLNKKAIADSTSRLLVLLFVAQVNSTYTFKLQGFKGTRWAIFGRKIHST